MTCVLFLYFLLLFFYALANVAAGYLYAICSAVLSEIILSLNIVSITSYRAADTFSSGRIEGFRPSLEYANLLRATHRLSVTV